MLVHQHNTVPCWRLANQQLASHTSVPYQRPSMQNIPYAGDQQCWTFQRRFRCVKLGLALFSAGLCCRSASHCLEKIQNIPLSVQPDVPKFFSHRSSPNHSCKPDFKVCFIPNVYLWSLSQSITLVWDWRLVCVDSKTEALCLWGKSFQEITCSHMSLIPINPHNAHRHV